MKHFLCGIPRYACTSLNLNKRNSGRQKTRQTEENIAAIGALLEENARASVIQLIIFLQASIATMRHQFLPDIALNGEVCTRNVRQHASTAYIRF